MLAEETPGLQMFVALCASAFLRSLIPAIGPLGIRTSTSVSKCGISPTTAAKAAQP